MVRRAKLPNGTGSIEYVKLSPQGKKRAKPWRARLPAKYTADGKAKRKDLGYFKTYNQALDALINYKKPKVTNTFKDLYLKYKDSREFKNLTKSTQLRYDNAFQRFYPIQDFQIHNIVYSDLQDIIEQMEEEGYDRYINGTLKHFNYSKDSLDRLKSVVNKVYTLAIKQGLVNINLANYLEIQGSDKKREKEIFTSKEIEMLYNSIPHNPNARHILTMIFTGMRTGEYTFLQKKNIFLEKNLIKDFGIKTEAGKDRILFIHPKIKDILTDLVNESKSGYIVEVNGKKIDYDHKFYNQIYYPALDKANVKRRIPYSCRYTFATIAFYSGVSEKALNEFMGHKNSQITKDFYILDHEDMQQYLYNELQKIDQYL